MNTATPIFEIQPQHGEGPLWCPIQKTFYCVDLLNGNYYKVDWNKGASEKFHVGQELGVMALCDDGRSLLAVRDGFGFFDEQTQQLELIANSPEIDIKDRRMNDGAIDPKGRFFAGTMEYDGSNPTGKLYCLHQDLTWSCQKEEMYLVNGMGWSPDHKTFYIIDTLRHLMYAYDYDLETGTISNRGVHIQWTNDEFPDGMCVDSEGGLWVAMWMGSKVSHFDGDGTWIEDVHVPVLHTTSCCFAGDELKTLIITTSHLNLSEKEKKENPLAGRCFVFETDVVGQIEPRFKT